MGKEKDIGGGACFVSNSIRRNNGNCAQLCQNTWDSHAGLEIDESVTIQTVYKLQ